MESTRGARGLSIEVGSCSVMTGDSERKDMEDLGS